MNTIKKVNYVLKKNKKFVNSGRGFVYFPIKDLKKVLVWELQRKYQPIVGLNPLKHLRSCCYYFHLFHPLI